jgi:glyoxylase-like metal-dependent hydrolase (beta-lactamase superfamily II)
MIPFVRDIQFEYGKVDQVSPLIRRVIANNPGPFTFTGTGTYIIGKGQVAVIDPGPDLDDHLEAILAALEGETVSHILITHNHLDHSPLARPLAARTGAKIYSKPIAATVQDSDVVTEAGDDEGFQPDVALMGGEIIKGPCWTFEAIHTPGHTSNHVCYALAEENTLFSGDHIMGWSTTVITPPDGDMGAYFASLEAIQARNFATLWPTHGPAITEVAPFIEAYSDHRRAREDQILAQLASGPASILAMVPIIYAAVDSRLHPVAARSIQAHVIHMAAQGRLVCDGPVALDSVLRLPG